jgi:hypothetical protein
MTEFLNTLCWTFVVFFGIVGAVMLAASFSSVVRRALSWENREDWQRWL